VRWKLNPHTPRHHNPLRKIRHNDVTMLRFWRYFGHLVTGA
jgi:hypothetical protein